MLNKAITVVALLGLVLGWSYESVITGRSHTQVYSAVIKLCVPPFQNAIIGTQIVGTQVCDDGTLGGEANTEGETAERDPQDSTAMIETTDSGPPTGPICEWYTLDQSSTAVNRGSYTPADGTFEGLKCHPREVDTTREETGGGSALVDTRFVPNAEPGQPVAPPPPDPAVLAEQAYGELEIPNPTIGAGPGREELAVNLWTWLWIDDPGELTNTVAAGGVSVTVTAALTSVEWSLGEPSTAGGEFKTGPPAKIVCEGSGTPPPATYDWKAEPPCGYMWH